MDGNKNFKVGKLINYDEWPPGFKVYDISVGNYNILSGSNGKGASFQVPSFTLLCNKDDDDETGTFSNVHQQLS